MLKTFASETTVPVYSSNCHVLHMDSSTPRSIVPHLGPNYLVSSYFSRFNSELYLASGLGLKFVPQGAETYWIKGKKYEVTGARYLLVNDTLPKLEAAVSTRTQGMCINIAPELLNDLLLQVICPNDLESMQQAKRFFLSPELLVREAFAGEALQQYLRRLYKHTANQQLENPAIELIFEVASVLVRENLETIGSYYKLPATKLSTRQELFQRLLQGKEMLDDSVFTEISIGQVAESCCLSEFRFFRLFKECFGQSPYNYLFRRRIAKSLELKQADLSWNEIAHQLNFTDQAAFSKAFKKVTGNSPSKFSL